jgi:hypothetical protein
VPGLRLLAVTALVAGAVLLVAGLALPTCRNYAGTSRDSGYPCKISRSSGATDFVFTSTIGVPLATPLSIGLIVLGVVGIARSRTP